MTFVYTYQQFTYFRIIFGIYLMIHFANLIPYAEELFSNNGMIKNYKDLPGYNFVPNILFWHDNPLFVRTILYIMVFLSLMITFEIKRRICSIIIFYGWICLLNRNIFISNPSMAYIGWLLLALTLIQEQDSKVKIKNDISKVKIKNDIWNMDSAIYYGAWIIMGVSYTASGINKLQCQSWWDGTALHNVLTGPLARPNNFIIDALLTGPDILIKFMTWISLFAEISFLPLGCFYHTRKWYWLFFVGLHMGILATINFADLTIGMMMIHIFTFDISWYQYFKSKFLKIISAIIILNKKIHNKNNKHKHQHTIKYIYKIDKTEELKILDKNYFDKLLLRFIILVTFCIWIVIGFNIKSFLDVLNRFSQITMNMFWGFVVIVGSLGFLMIMERIYPNQKLKRVDGWWRWLLFTYSFQGFAVIFAAYTWEIWLQNTSYFKSTVGFHLRDYVTPFTGGLIGYLINTWLFYWWHLARHRIYILWILTHQMHHSPTRLETITSFYKHPIEIMLDSQIMAVLMYAVLGLSQDSSVWLSIFSAIGEYIYHMNMKTPKWLGYIFQRPEAHRLHHRINSRLNCPNYSDIVIWDILGGTFDNPDIDHIEDTGFPNKEEFRCDILFFKDVLWPSKKIMTWKKTKSIINKGLIYILVIWGSINSVAYLCHEDRFSGIGFAFASSPLPLVFTSYRNVETFSTMYEMDYMTIYNDTVNTKQMDSKLYSMLDGPYNRRNVYGAMFSHGLLFDNNNLIKMRDEILYYGVCNPGLLIKEFGINAIKQLNISMMSKTKDDNRRWNLQINCF